MKTKVELEKNINDIMDTINEYFDKLTDAMCDGDNHQEREYQKKIRGLESRVEVLKWVIA